MTERSNGDNHQYQDKLLVCVDCGRDFVFSAGEQAFFFSKRPPLAEPKRCKACRDLRKRTINPPTKYDETIARTHALFPNDHSQGVR